MDAANCNTTADISSNSVTGDFVTITIAPMTGGYSIKVNSGTNSGKYIYGTSGSNKLNFGTTAQLNTLSYEADWVKITSNTSVLTFNKASSDMRFRYYKAASYSAQQHIQLYKISTSIEPPTSTTQYTIKWHTAKGVTTDVTLNEGATITKPATDPAMTGYEFMGWTASCSVASDGSDFTALTDFGTADSDKDFYAVFAKATTTGGGGTATTGSVTMKYSGTTTNMTEGNNAAAVNLDADEWSVVPTKGSASNIPGLNKDGDIRLYGHASGGNYLTITSKSYTITSAEITYTGTSYNNGKFYVNGVETAAGNINSKEFVIKNANSGTSQVRIKTLVINYTSGSAGTTTYSDYITTCASGIEYVELGDDFKWSATEAEVTIDATDNVFPTLTNTHNVPVTYSSSDDAIASIASDGTVTLKKEGSVTITAKYEGGTSAGTGKEYKAKTVTYSLKVNKAAPVASGTTYVKVTSTAGITNGEYLIVYEDASNATPAPVAFDGSLETLDAVSNNIAVTITDGTIAGNTDIDAATFTIDATAGTIKSASGYYIGKTATGNGLNTHTTTKYTNTITIDANQNAVVVSSGGPTLRYNKASDQARFRYYGSGQQAIALYKKASKHTVTIDDAIQYGSVNASVANGAQVLSGTTVTLENTPATGYKLSAYDVYKTDDATTKVTETDGKFIMPEFDVTISATFELAKTLTGIEITTPATQTTFWQTETFNHNGLKVTAHFDGAEGEDVTDKVTVTGSTDAAGTQTVEVSFTEGSTTKTATYSITVKAIPNTKETAYTVADAFDIIDKLTTAEGVFIKGIVSQVDSYNSTYKSITYWISADGTTTNQLQVYSGKGLESADFTAVTDVAKGAQVIVCGNLKKHNTTYEFDYNNYLAAYTAPTKAEPGIAYETTEYTANVNEAFTAPTLTNPNDLTVAYSTSDATLATVDATTGAVTILDKAGKVTITASFAGNAAYLPGTASYNITITDPSISEATFVAATDLGNTTRGEGSIAKSPITFACSDGVLGNGSEYRLYQDANITFAAENGYAITKVVITSTASGTSQYGPGLLSTENGTYSVSDKMGTWVGEAQTVTFTATAQSRAKLITVYYKTDNRQDAGLAWSDENVSITLGDAFTAPTLSNSNGLTLTCTSDNENLATVTNAGVVTLKSGVTGKATITAKFDGNSNYKDATVTCTITVNPKTEIVVILAQYNGQWYALKNVEETAGKVLAALEVTYFNGTLYNVADADKATIEWQRAAVTDGIIFKNGENYIYGTEGSTDLKLSTTECAWTLDGSTYKIGNRTFIYNETANGFKNYNTSNAGNSGYSNLPVVTAPVYETATFYTRSELTEGNYGTICLPYASNNYTGATFFEVVGKENNKIVFDEVTALEAGKPYIFLAEATEIKVAQIGEAAIEAGNHNSLQGTFTQIDPAVDNVLKDNYMVVNNVIKMCGANCGLKANRAYFIADELDDLGTPSAPAPSVRRISMGVTGQNTATGVDQVQGDEVPAKMIINGQLFILLGEKMYDAQGKLVK